MDIFVNGYWNKNLGDDLFLKIISEKFPNIKFHIILSQDNYKSLKGLPNVYPKYINLSALNKLINKLANITKLILPGSTQRNIINMSKNTDITVDLGGSIFQLPKKGMDSQYNIRKHFALNKYLVIGSNFGPYYHDFQLRKYKKIFKQAYNVSFRDKYSYELFKEIRQVNYYPDLIFSLNIKKYIEHCRKDYVLFSVIYPRSSNYYDLYFEWISKNIKKQIKLGHKIVLMSFCEREKDLLFVNKIYDSLESNIRRNVSIYNHEDIEKSLFIIANAQSVVASRFHAMILAWLFNKPVFVIGYSEKFKNVINDIAPSQAYVDIADLKLSTDLKFSNYPSNYFDQYVEKSKLHFSGLQKVILNNEK